MPRPQFRLRSLFIVTALVAVALVLGPPIGSLGPPIARWVRQTPIARWVRKTHRDYEIKHVGE
jgi:hypothetical protein